MDELAFLAELLSIPSPSGDEDAVASFLVERMAEFGLEAGRDGAGNVLGSAGAPDAGRTIALLGHMDTVPGFIPVRQDAGRLYGRGAVDAKGPLAAFVLAAGRVAPALEETRLLVIATVEEEASGRGARHLARTMPPPTFAVIGEPSSWEGITLGYKGMLSVDYRLLQPGGHSAGQLPGPAEKAIEFWNSLLAYSAGYNNGRSGHFHTLDPALGEICTFSDGVFDGVEMNISTRLPPGLEVPVLEELMESWCDGAELKFHPSDPPFQAEKNTPVVRALLRAIRASGGQPRFKLKTGTSDMNLVGPVWECPMVAYGPGDSALDHTPDEHVIVKEFRQAVGVLEQALKFLAG
jgi:LysW-gamma-L-lysine carboxypeptidase